MKNQNGFTSMELLVVIMGVASLIGTGFVIYIAVHFISKFW